MKKYLSIFLCALMLLSLLAGCGGGGDTTAPTEEKHTHTYETEWTFDATSHWYQATCGHDALKANFGDHLDENLDGICDVCSYEDTTHQHTYAETWTTDAENHWKSATCIHVGSVAEKAPHVDDDNDGACDVCAYTGDHEHTFLDGWVYNDNQHWHEASCGHTVEGEKADHMDANNDGECDTCGWFDSTHTHTFSDEWKYDVAFHWHAATCEHVGAVSEKDQHADTDEDGFCDTCAYLMCTHEDFDLDGECDTCGWTDPDHTHEFGTEIGSDVNGHWYVATCHPGAISPVEEHVDKNHDGVCDVCSFQICGHSFASVWSYDDTHHWHAILCTCAIDRKDYAQHVDADNDGGCDVCMYGLPVDAVYETIIDNASIALDMSKMITYTPFTVNFPQPGKYVITPNRGDLDIRVWLTDGSDYGSGNSFFNSTGPLTVEVEEAGEMTLWFRMFTWTYGANMTHEMTYSVVRADDLVIETMQGKVELPANTIYIAKFIAKEVGTYKLITGVDGLVIGLTEDSMEYYKGHIELDVTEIGQEFTLYLLYEDEAVNSFIFDWQLVEPFCLSVGEGNFSVDVGPTQVDYKIEFTAPTDGYFLLQVHNQWLTFAQMGEIYNTPVRMETMEVLTHYMTAGEVYTIWLQTVYDYPESTNVYDTLTITNVGEKLSVGSNTVNPGAAGSRYCFQVSQSSYYRITVSGGELGVIASNGSITWTSAPYEVNLGINQTYTFMLRGDGDVQIHVESVDYSLSLEEGDNQVVLVPNRFYEVITESGTAMDPNNQVTFTWVGNIYIYVDGREIAQGETVSIMHSSITVLAKGSTDVEAVITVTIAYDSNAGVEGQTEAALYLNQVALLAANKEGSNTGAKADFVAEYGGTYTLTCQTEGALIYVVSSTGTNTLVITGAGSYTFSLDAGETIEFFVNTENGEAMTVALIVEHA